MQQSRLNLRKLNDPELDNFLLSRKPMIRTKTGLINHYLRKHNDELETIHSSPSIQNPEKQHPILDFYSKNKELKKGSTSKREIFLQEIKMILQSIYVIVNFMI